MARGCRPYSKPVDTVVGSAIEIGAVAIDLDDYHHWSQQKVRLPYHPKRCAYSQIIAGDCELMEGLLLVLDHGLTWNYCYH